MSTTRSRCESLSGSKNIIFQAREQETAGCRGEEAGEGVGDQARFSRQLALRFSLIAMLDRIGFVQTFETPKSGEITKIVQ
jgi:hypothetical protein